MAHQEEITPQNITKNLVKSFESGKFSRRIDTDPDLLKEELTNITPGLTKELVQTYESINKKVEPKWYKVLVVFAHWERSGTTDGALLDATVSTLEEQGHTVTVSDLYSLGFNPLPSKADITDGPENKTSFNYMKESEAAFRRGKLAEDIMDELDKLEDADLVIFQFPLCWGGMPAILKGYFDRVLVPGATYSNRMMFDEGKFKGKKALVSITTGDEESVYSNRGIEGDMEVFLWPIYNSILRFIGFDLLPANVFYSAAYNCEECSPDIVEKWTDRLMSIFEEPLIPSIALENFDRQEGFVLSDDAIVNLTENDPDYGLNVGQNLGKPYQPSLVYDYPILAICPEEEIEEEEGTHRTEEQGEQDASSSEAAGDNSPVAATPAIVESEISNLNLE